MHFVVLALFAMSGAALGENPAVKLALPSQAPVYIFLNNNFAGGPVTKKDDGEGDGGVSGSPSEIELGADQKGVGNNGSVEAKEQVKAGDVEEKIPDEGDKAEVQANSRSVEADSKVRKRRHAEFLGGSKSGSTRVALPKGFLFGGNLDGGIGGNFGLNFPGLELLFGRDFSVYDEYDEEDDGQVNAQGHQGVNANVQGGHNFPQNPYPPTFQPQGPLPGDFSRYPGQSQVGTAFNQAAFGQGSQSLSPGLLAGQQLGFQNRADAQRFASGQGQGTGAAQGQSQLGGNAAQGQQGGIQGSFVAPSGLAGGVGAGGNGAAQGQSQLGGNAAQGQQGGIQGSFIAPSGLAGFGTGGNGAAQQAGQFAGQSGSGVGAAASGAAQQAAQAGGQPGAGVGAAANNAPQIAGQTGAGVGAAAIGAAQQAAQIAGQTGAGVGAAANNAAQIAGQTGAGVNGAAQVGSQTAGGLGAAAREAGRVAGGFGGNGAGSGGIGLPAMQAAIRI